MVIISPHRSVRSHKKILSHCHKILRALVALVKIYLEAKLRMIRQVRIIYMCFSVGA